MSQHSAQIEPPRTNGWAVAAFALTAFAYASFFISLAIPPILLDGKSSQIRLAWIALWPDFLLVFVGFVFALLARRRKLRSQRATSLALVALIADLAVFAFFVLAAIWFFGGMASYEF